MRTIYMEDQITESRKVIQQACTEVEQGSLPPTLEASVAM